MKRQTSQLDAMVSRHTLSVDITSPAFIDANFRFASHKDGITASVSSPSAGFLGLHFQRRSPSQLHGKLFCRFLSTTDKDTDILSIKATLRNSEKLHLQTAWNLECLHNVIEGSKDRIPAITEAVLRFINKYHTAHFGFDLNRGGMKLKNSISSVIERAYNELSAPFNTLENSLEQLSDQSKDMVRKASDSIISINVQEVVNRLNNNARQFLRHSEERLRNLMDAIAKFLSDTTFTLPGSQQKLTSLEIFQRIHRSASRAFDRAVQRFFNLMETTGNQFREIEFTIPGTNVVINGEKILENWMSFVDYIHDQLVQAAHGWFEVFRTTINDILQVIGKKWEDLIAYLKDENHEIAPQIDAICAEALQYSKQHIGEVRRNMAEYKDLTKEKAQEAYNAMNMEDINSDLKEFISILQSHLCGGVNEYIDLMKRASQSTQPYIRVSTKKMDIDIPLPFFWKSFSEWPIQSRQ
ncbi:hypothetical protein LDENG_00071100 [Lucifuga dentata]|nr:hypothetical protein LDENG_00071100 [Lucifuga dentata]